MMHSDDKFVTIHIGRSTWQGLMSEAPVKNNAALSPASSEPVAWAEVQRLRNAIVRLNQALDVQRDAATAAEADAERLTKDLRNRARYLAMVEAQRDHAEVDAGRLAEAGTIQYEAHGACRNLIEALAAHRQRAKDNKSYCGDVSSSAPMTVEAAAKVLLDAFKDEQWEGPISRAFCDNYCGYDDVEEALRALSGEDK